MSAGMPGTVLTICLCVLLNIDACESLVLRSMQSPEIPVLGNNSLTLTCEYTKATSNTIFTITLKRRLPGQTTYDIVVTYVEADKYVRYGNVAGIDSRTTAIFTDVGDYPFLQFSSILCEDKADYLWEVSYLDVTAVSYTSATFSVKLKASTTFITDSEPIIISPSPPVLEGDRVTFTCKGDVGNEPAGHLRWFYFLNNADSGAIDISNQAVPNAPQDNPNRACSKQRMSVLQMNMTRSLNRMIVRCTVQQDMKDEFGEGYRQTDGVTVLYGPDVPTITTDPPRYGFTVGENVALRCDADANPSAQFYWRLPDNISLMGSNLVLTNLTENHSGRYMCVENNVIKGSSYTSSYSVTLTITTPTPTSTSSVGTPSTSSVPAQTAQTSGYSLEEVIGALCGGFIAGIVLSAVIGVSVHRRLRHSDVQKQPSLQLDTTAASTERSMEPVQEPASQVHDVGSDNYDTLTNDRPHQDHGYSTLKF